MKRSLKNKSIPQTTFNENHSDRLSMITLGDMRHTTSGPRSACLDRSWQFFAKRLHGHMTTLKHGILSKSKLVSAIHASPLRRLNYVEIRKGYRI